MMELRTVGKITMQLKFLFRTDTATDSEIAQNLKEQGNEYFKGKRYREALGFYTQGVDAKPEDNNILEALMNNRAACNLELSEPLP